MINLYTYSLGTIFLVGLATIVAASEIGWQVGRAGRIAVLSYKSTRTFAAPLLASTVPATSGSIATPQTNHAHLAHAREVDYVELLS